jgi:molybdopterin-guanine dinucleotide biosynthesis protein A
MGTDKAEVLVGGIPMARLVADALAAGGCHQVIAVGGAARSHGLPVVDDLAPGEGPLGAVLSVLESVAAAAGAGPVLVVSCDLPTLDASTVSTLLDRAARGDADLVVATTDRVQSLVAVWSVGALGVVRREFAAGERSIRRVVPLLDVALVPVDPDAVRNVNTPADLPD